MAFASGQCETIPLFSERSARRKDSWAPATMAVIILETVIAAPRERVFDLARSIDVHQATVADTGERAIAGVTSGLLGLGEAVTWRARHLGVVQQLSVRMKQLHRPVHFQDAMVQGAFRSMVHDHFFDATPAGTLMRDRFEFTAPLGVLGLIAERIFLIGYMRRLLAQRNAALKSIAESDAWREYLKIGSHA